MSHFTIFLLGISFAASAFGGMLGMASGIFIVPLLTTLGGVDIHSAIGASLDAITMESAWDIPEPHRADFPHLSAAQQAVTTSHMDRFAFLADVLSVGLKAAISGGT